MLRCLVIAHLLLPSIVHGAGQAVVLRVHSGDELTVGRLGRRALPLTVRLHGVAAPRPDQLRHEEARRLAERLVYGRLVTLVPVRRDPEQGALVARVIVRGKPLGRELVAAGLAWHDTRGKRDGHLARLQARARQAGRGLWADPDPVPPWLFSAVMLVGDTATKLYHVAARCQLMTSGSCRTCRESFASGKQAAAAGYKPHVCVRPQDLKNALNMVRSTQGNRPDLLTQLGQSSGGAIPPRRPWPRPEERRCRADDECALAPVPPGICGPCGTRWRRGVRSQVARRLERLYKRLRFARFGCPRCLVRSIGSKARCVKELCSAAR